MKPLTHWAIHHQIKLRLGGRDDVELWGELVSRDGSSRPFRFNRRTLQLVIGRGQDQRTIQLDEYGFEQ